MLLPFSAFFFNMDLLTPGSPVWFWAQVSVHNIKFCMLSTCVHQFLPGLHTPSESMLGGLVTLKLALNVSVHGELWWIDVPSRVTSCLKIPYLPLTLTQSCNSTTVRFVYSRLNLKSQDMILTDVKPATAVTPRYRSGETLYYFKVRLH